MSLAALVLAIADSKWLATLLSLRHERPPTPVTGVASLTLPPMTAAAVGFVGLSATAEGTSEAPATLTVEPRADP